MASVIPCSEAARAGVGVGCVVRSAGGLEVASFAELAAAVKATCEASASDTRGSRPGRRAAKMGGDDGDEEGGVPVKVPVAVRLDASSGALSAAKNRVRQCEEEVAAAAEAALVQINAAPGSGLGHDGGLPLPRPLVSSSSNNGGVSGGGGGSHPLFATDQRQRSNSQHRSCDGAAFIAAHGSHGIPMDCGLCALKNVTANPDIDGVAAFDEALALQSELEAERQSGASSSVNHFDRGVGNLSGKAIRSIARTNGYALYRLARGDGECGFARALVEHMCILARERVCGVIWRLGPGVEGVAASHGHWAGASYIYGAGDWSTHR